MRHRRTAREIEREYELAKGLKGNEDYCAGYCHALEWVLDPAIPTMSSGRYEEWVDSSSGRCTVRAECGSCGEVPPGDCPKSRRPCGHHCNCSWTHDACCWCGQEFGDDEGPDVHAKRWPDNPMGPFDV